MILFGIFKRILPFSAKEIRCSAGDCAVAPPWSSAWKVGLSYDWPRLSFGPAKKIVNVKN